MNSVAGLRNITLQIPAPSFDHLRQQQRLSEDGTNLLYKTYQDYFRMEEEITSPASDETSSPLDLRALQHVPPIAPPQHQSPKDETTKPSTTMGPFFFVLSASSPLTPLTLETGFTPIPPDIADDIPESLSQLLPQPSISLLDVIKGAESGVSHEPEISIDHGSFPKPRSSGRLQPESSHHLHLRDNTASRLFSQAIIEPSDPPTSATAEVAPVLPSPALEPHPGPWPYPGPMQDLYMRVNHPSPGFIPIGHRPRGTQSMDMSPRQPVTTRGHIRGLSSPLPLPIQFTFAPPSVTGSATTPYSYF